MTTFQAYKIVANGYTVNRQLLSALCVLINSGYLYTMPGVFGRFAQLVIDNGLITLNEEHGATINEERIDEILTGEIQS